MIETRKSIGRPFDGGLEPSVLRHAAFGNVQLGHDFQARNDLLGDIRAVHRSNRDEHPVDPVSDHQSGIGRFQVDVAGAGAQCIEDGRVHELDDRARIHVDRGERQILDFAVRAGTRLRGNHGRIDGAHPDFVPRQVAADVGARGDCPAERRGDPHFEPGAQVRIKGIRDDHQKTIGAVDQHAVATRRIGRRQKVERGLKSGELGRAHVAVIEDAPERRGQFSRAQPALFFEHRQRRMSQPPRLVECRRQLHFCQIRDIGLVERCIHLMLPASSKMGKYMSTTMAPMMSPMTVISTGSIKRVMNCTQRPSSSS